MLHYSTIDAGTLDVLKRMMAIPELASFNLVGGTALALYFGHRISIDLDLFSSNEFNSDEIIEAISHQFPEFEYTLSNKIGVFGFIGSIKTDLVSYHIHPMIGPIHIEDSIRLLSLDDIMAMKISAILKRAAKKDFYDIAELLEHFPLQKLIDAYRTKFPSQQLLISIPQALTYFQECEDGEDPISLNNSNWESVKERISQKVSDFLK